ncbi:hypothetical protein F5Y13DRAFT_160475 [Hypoxylon sp. FL1857]|nr:hypothetical protein F5Y13DRAFT_160475 [Hypoxylon sp. FL1857]
MGVHTEGSPKRHNALWHKCSQSYGLHRKIASVGMSANRAELDNSGRAETIMKSALDVFNPYAFFLVAQHRNRRQKQIRASLARRSRCRAKCGLFNESLIASEKLRSVKTRNLS